MEDTAGYIDQTQRILSTLATIGRLPMSAAKDWDADDAFSIGGNGVLFWGQRSIFRFGTAC